MPRTLSAAVRVKVTSWIGMIARLCGKIAGLTEMEQHAIAQLGASALDESLEEPFPAHPGQPSIPPIEPAIPAPPSCAIGIGTAAMACPTTPMPKATSRTSERRRAIGPSLMGAEVTLTVRRFKPRPDGAPGSRSREPERKHGYRRS